MVQEVHAELYCGIPLCCVKQGECIYTAKFDKPVYFKGDTVEISLKINNRSGFTQVLVATLIQWCKTEAQHYSRENKWDLAQHVAQKLGSTPQNVPFPPYSHEREYYKIHYYKHRLKISYIRDSIGETLQQQPFNKKEIIEDYSLSFKQPANIPQSCDIDDQYELKYAIQLKFKSIGKCLCNGCCKPNPLVEFPILICREDFDDNHTKDPIQPEGWKAIRKNIFSAVITDEEIPHSDR